MEFNLNKVLEEGNLREEELLRAQERDLWCKMLVAVANDSRVTKMAVATHWANLAADEFNKRYNKGK